LCRHHHRLVHEGGYQIETDRNRLVFRHPNGWELQPLPTPRPGGDLDLNDFAIDNPTAIASRWDGGHLDLDTTIETLLWIEHVRGVSAETPHPQLN
jgi:hypothetical protein